LISSLLGAAFCTLVFGVFCWWGRGFGGGDVKLMAALGALAGFIPALTIAMCVTLVGGIMAIARIAFFGDRGEGFRRLVQRRKNRKGEPITVPYGIAIAVGAVWAVLIRFQLTP